jgi:ankyrin repeat protein
VRILLVPIAVLSLYAGVHDLAGAIIFVDEFKKREITYSAEEYSKRAGMGDAYVVNLFLAKGMKVDSRDKNGATSLTRAAENGHADVVKLILSKKADTNATDNNGYTALMVATEGRHVEIIKALISAGADINAKNPKWGTNALMMACIKGNMDSVEALLNGGADVNDADNNGYTALMLAAEKGHMEVVKKLVENGADRNVRNTKWRVTASYIASYNGHKDIADFLKKNRNQPAMRHAAMYNAERE